MCTTCNNALAFVLYVCTCAFKTQSQNEKKHLEEMQTLHTGCSKAEPKIFAKLQTPFPGALDGQNLITWRWSLPLPTNPVWWGSMHVISSYYGNRPTNTTTNPHTNRQDRLQYTVPQLVRSVIIEEGILTRYILNETVGWSMCHCATCHRILWKSVSVKPVNKQRK